MNIKYNHVGFIGFTIISEEENPENLTSDVLRSALLKKIIALDADCKNNQSRAWDNWQDAVDFGESYVDEKTKFQSLSLGL